MKHRSLAATTGLLLTVAFAPSAEAWLSLGKNKPNTFVRAPSNIVANVANPECAEIAQKMDHIKNMMAKKNEMFMDACFVNNELASSWESHKCNDATDRSALDCEAERVSNCLSTKGQLQTVSNILGDSIEDCNVVLFLAGWDWIVEVYNTSHALNCGFSPPIYPNDPVKTFKAHAQGILGAEAQSCYKKYGL